MSDWENWEDDNEATNVTNNDGGGDWDDWCGGDDVVAETTKAAPAAAAANEWAGDEWETEPDREAEKKKELKNKKKTLKELAKEKEAQEKAEKEKAAKLAEEEKQRLMQDPDYRLKLKEQEKAAIERSELDMISDLFGSNSGPSSKDEMRKEANPERARALAACSGLMDGADGNDDFVPEHGDVDMFAMNVQKTDKRAAPNPLDEIDFKTDEDVKKFVTMLVRKVKDVGTKTTTNNTQTMSKVLLCELVRELGPGMKTTDVDEVLRLTTVVKNDQLKSQSTKNPKKKSKKTIKTYDDGRDFSDDDY